MKPFSEMSMEELVDYWSGYLLIEIGRGKFRSGVCLLIQAVLTEGSKSAEERLKKSGKK